MSKSAFWGITCSIGFYVNTHKKNVTEQESETSVWNVHTRGDITGQAHLFHLWLLHYVLNLICFFFRLKSIISEWSFPAACSAAAWSCLPVAASVPSPLAPHPLAAAQCSRRSPAGCGLWLAWRRWSSAEPPWKHSTGRESDRQLSTANNDTPSD